MGVCCAITGLILVLLTSMTNAAASNPPGPEASTVTKSCNVRNAPFSADVITQYDRALDNGGHIHRESHGKIYRDSSGRMRTETELSGLQPGAERTERVTINDPVQQVMIYLNPRNKTATVIRFGDASTSAKQSKPKEKTKFRVGGQPGIGGGPTDTLGVPSVPSGQGNTPSNPSIPARDGMSSKTDSGVLANAGATVVPLGTKLIDGLSATGTRTTRTINAGTMGNDTPIISISDTWFASELKATILTETDDGQAGRSTMKLVNIIRSEPASALFQIPPDYAVKEDTTTASAKQ